ncbi:MAG TPA: putative dsRNA-binding protein, partial [Dehalococcoidia bacterium]|nr:putative dsRNA-binding protein [Dehalococcoidia bacterium]
ERFVLRQLGGRLRALDVEALLDPKSRLQHLTQARWHVAPQYTLVAAQGPDHERRFTVQVDVAGEVMAQGAGASKQDAERIAAERALATLADRGIAHEPGDGTVGAT